MESLTDLWAGIADGVRSYAEALDTTGDSKVVTKAIVDGDEDALRAALRRYLAQKEE